MDEPIRKKLRNVVTQCRKLLEEAVAQVLQGQFGIYASSKKDDVHVEDLSRMGHLGTEDSHCRSDLLDHFEHIKSLGYKPTEALAQLVREIAFTHLNRLCAYKMMEAREVWVGGQKFREAVSRGLKSQGFLFFLAQHPEDEKLHNTGHQDIAYRHFLDWLGCTLSEEIGVLFSPTDPANRLYPPQRVLEDVIDLLDGSDIKPEDIELREQWPNIWSQDETIGWVYQYFTPKELRDQVRKESAAPRNSYELAFRNQFFTPRYVVEFLTDNTLGRIWYEMRQGDTQLKEQCRYLVRHRNEVFLKHGQEPPKDAVSENELSQEELLKQPIYIPHRPKKDPRELKILDPACGSGHFLLYCFDLLETIYEEAYNDPDLGKALKNDYSTVESLRKDMPRLILAHNLHGIDIDMRATQIAALSLWLRCQRAYKGMGVTKDRPKINRSNMVCAEPMPGEKEMLKEFTAELQPKLLGHLVEVVFDKMKLAGEAGSLLKIEDELRDAIATARKQWGAEHERAVDKKGQPMLFSQGEIDRTKKGPHQPQMFDLSEITEEGFWIEAEARVLESLQDYAAHATNGGRLRHQLFAEDAGHGFAFIDVCQKRFDAVLMNPPFGECSALTEPSLDHAYPTWNTNLLCAFIARAWELTSANGAVGVIYDRTAAVKSTYENFRRNVLLPDHRLTAVADLGWEVLDANVEVTTAVLHRSSISEGCFVDARKSPTASKGEDIAASIRLPRQPRQLTTVTWASAHSFLCLPNAVLAYDFPEYLRVAFSSYHSLEECGITAAQGHALKAEVHYRLFWEIDPSQAIGANHPWIAAFKGGEYSPYFLKTHYIALYGPNGSLVPKSTANVLRNKPMHTKPGIGYGKRGEFLDAQVLAAGQIFTHEGHAFPSLSEEMTWVTLCLINSRLFQYGLNCYCGQHKHSGYVNLFPFSDHLLPVKSTLCQLAHRVYSIKELWARGDETHLMYCYPHVLFSRTRASLGMAVEEMYGRLAEWDKEIQAIDEKIERIVSEAYRVSDEERAIIRTGTFNRPTDKTAYDASLSSLPRAYNRLSAELISYCVGCCFGRWDIRLATSPAHMEEPHPFGALPEYPIAHLEWHSGIGAMGDYPIEYSTSGILVDDPGAENDIVQSVHRCFDLLWNSGSDDALSEVVNHLGDADLRSHFRRTSGGGFWGSHVESYSQSSRKAPIYWLLQSSKKNYALWLYYHRIDKDILFKALVNYVEPKIRLEEIRLASLRGQKGSQGNSGKDTLDKDIEKQEDFLSELRDFEEKLRRAANLHLEPDLNDGVALNIAPLWELVPWKDAKAYWEELLQGEYEWSSIGKQLRERGLVK